MIKSMTGYGAAHGNACGMAVTMELRSVNNRYLDCTIRIPRVYTAVEDGLKAVVNQHISRGKVDVYVTIDSSDSNNYSISVNHDLAASYVSAIRSLAETYHLNSDISAVSLAKFQDVLRIDKKETDTDEFSAELCSLLSTACDSFDTMRKTEGLRLFEDISKRLDEIGSLIDAAESRSAESVKDYREKLYAKMSEVLGDYKIDENRILLEAAIFADRVAVNEEIVRLRSHVFQLRGMLELDEPVGRKIDFLVQEMNREANTMGSKGNDGEMAKIVIDLKAEIEKIREQIQNVE